MKGNKDNHQAAPSSPAPADNLTELDAALVNIERRYNELLKAVTDYTFTVVIENGIAVKTVHSSTCLEVTGYSPSEYYAHPELGLEMIHWEDKDNVLRQIAQVLTGQDSAVIEHRIYHKDGSIRWIQNTVVRRYDTHGRFIAYDGLIRDITDRKKIEMKIENAAREWGNTFDSITDYVSVHDTDFRFVRINKALAAFLKISPPDAIGKRCFETLHGTSEPWPNCPHMQALHDRKTVVEEVVDPATGAVFAVTCSPYFDETGELLGSVHLMRDITRQKQVEEERELLISQLRKAMAEVKVLSGFLPICASCKKIRDDQGYWNQIESYIQKHSEARFSHGICQECARKLYPDFVGEDGKLLK